MSCPKIPAASVAPATTRRHDPAAENRLSLSEVVRQFGIPRERLLQAIRSLEIYAEGGDIEWQFRWADIHAWFWMQMGGRS